MFTPGVSPQHWVFLLLLNWLHFTYPHPPPILQKRAWSVWNTSFAPSMDLLCPSVLCAVVLGAPPPLSGPGCQQARASEGEGGPWRLVSGLAA